MSLINDALKKANEAPNPATPPLPSPLARPARPPSRGLPLPAIIFSVLLCLVLAVAAFFLVRGMKRDGASKVSAREREREAFKAELEKETASQPRVKVQAPAVGVAPVTNTVAAVAPAQTTNGFPVLKVQGIFYRAKNPGAMVNSKTVFVGDRVSEAKVIAITADSVTVEYAGKTKVLSLY